MNNSVLGLLRLGIRTRELNADLRAFEAIQPDGTTREVLEYCLIRINEASKALMNEADALSKWPEEEV